MTHGRGDTYHSSELARAQSLTFGDPENQGRSEEEAGR